MNIYYIALAVLLAVACFALRRAVMSPGFWFDLAASVVTRLSPLIAGMLGNVLKPRDMTEQEKSDFRQAVDGKDVRQDHKPGVTITKPASEETWRGRRER